VYGEDDNIADNSLPSFEQRSVGSALTKDEPNVYAWKTAFT